MKPVLAQYTIRSKQEYIYRTNKIVEIVGASAHIRDAWKYLFECANNLGLKVVKAENNVYNHMEIISNLETKEAQIVELFCGGGNETIIVDSFETYITLNKAFSFYLLKNCPGMIPMAVCVPVTDNYKTDYSNLMKKAEIEKNRMSAGQDTFILPFSMMDRDTFKPMTVLSTIEGKSLRYSEESYTKRVKGIAERNSDNAVKMLDDMITKKGEESLLAVVHADGNNMGSKIMKMLDGKTSYDDCVALMREFTLDTAQAFGSIGLKAIEDKQSELSSKAKNKSALSYRVIIKDGDDMTFICNASYAMDYVKAYIEAVQNYKSKWNYSSCAGICIFHSHYPFAKAYSMAEQACDDGAKRMVHKTTANGEPIPVEEGWVDFHYIHSGIGGNLGEVRNLHNTEGCMARPWIITGNNSSSFKLDSLYMLGKLASEHGLARASIKGIGAAAEESVEIGLRELRRIYDHYPALKDHIKAMFEDEKDQLKAFYDFAEVYDLWFKEDK